MKKITLLIYLTLFVNLLNSQTISEFSTGYTALEGIAINSNNEVHVSEHDSGKIYKLDSSGNKTLIATAGGFANDMVFDTNNNLYVTEPFTNKISVIDNMTGVMSEYISTFSIGNSPYGIDFYNNLIYFSSETNANIIEINSDLTTSNYAIDFFTPEGIAFDFNGNLYIADRNDRKLFKITPAGVKTTIASNIKNIRGVAVSPRNEVYFTMYNDFPVENKIIKYDPITNTISDFVTTILDQPRSLEIDNLGNMFVTNIGNGVVIKINDTSLLPDPNLVFIPDTNFKSELINNASINTNMDGEIQKSEAVAFTGFMGLANKNISDLTGIEEFTEITNLNCSRNTLTSIDVSNNSKLTTLNCSNNSFSVLDVTNNVVLMSLYCTDNNLSNINTSQNTNLINFWCQRNAITSLDVSNNILLEQFICSNNLLSNIDVTNNIALKSFTIGQNSLTNLDLTMNVDLERLDFFNNDISTIDLSNNTELTYLDCQTNGMTSLDLSLNTKLTEIKVGSNILIDELDLTNNVLLEDFSFQSVSINTLNLSNNINLSKILGSSTSLTTIDLRSGNNTNITDFSILNATNLSCIFVDDKDYSIANWTNPNPGTSNFVETEVECSTLSIDDLRIVDFKIYPNPTSTILNINIPFEKATIYNIQGKELLKSSSQNINIGNLSKGLYLIQLEDKNNNIYSTKFIKE